MNTQFNQDIRVDQIKISDQAAAQFAQLVSEAEDNILGIRIFVQGGGCGGMQYGMTYADQTSDYDKRLDGNGYTLFVDTFALDYLKGCDIDYVREGLNESFVFNNVFNSVGGSGRCGGCGGGGF